MFVSTGKCFVVEALIQFFNMESKDGQPTQDKPPYHILEFGDNKTLYYNTVLDKFLEEYLIVPTPSAIVQDFQRWLGRHKRNILLNALQAQDEDDEE